LLTSRFCLLPDFVIAVCQNCKKISFSLLSKSLERVSDWKRFYFQVYCLFCNLETNCSALIVGFLSSKWLLW
jgi:hypothetical protein